VERDAKLLNGNHADYLLVGIMQPPNFKEVIAASPLVFTIGVAGDSGSGKTTFTSAIRKIFGADLVSTITLDDYHIYDRDQRRRHHITPLIPEANDIARLERDLAALKSGQEIHKPVYNHQTGHLDDAVPFQPTKIVILEGLHTLSTPRLRDLLDYTLFVDPVPDIKYEWKILRDTGARGYAQDQVLREMSEREPDYHAYIKPQRQYADAIIRINHSRYGRHLGPEENIYQVTLCQKKLDQAIEQIDLSIDLFCLLSLCDRHFLLEYHPGTFFLQEMGALTFDGVLAVDMVRKLEQSVERQTRVHPIAMSGHGPHVTAGDIVQLILSWRIINRRIFMEQGQQMKSPADSG
jgi:phosphoribulokinase